MGNMRKEIEEKLSKYDRILFFDTGEEEIYNLLCGLLESEAFLRSKKKIMIYGKRENNMPDRNKKYKCLNDSDFSEAKDLYYSYEFSNRVSMILNDSRYPSLRNYLMTGILTEEEFYEALLS